VPVDLSARDRLVQPASQANGHARAGAHRTRLNVSSHAMNRRRSHAYLRCQPGEGAPSARERREPRPPEREDQDADEDDAGFGRRGRAPRRTVRHGTLEAYYAAGGSPRHTATALHVHVNTVAPLERIAALLGPSWHQPDRVFEIQPALRLRLMPR
jgi:hypothetical protein